MAVNLKTKLTSLENIFIKNNTTTSAFNISSGLSTQVRSFYKGVSGFAESMPIPLNKYPAVVVELSTKDEDLNKIGTNAKRDMEVYYNIIPIVCHIEAPGDNNRSKSDLELITLSQNLEALIRGNITLSTTCDWSEIETTNYSEVYRNDTFVSQSRIVLKTILYNQR